MNYEQFILAVQHHAGDGEEVARRAASKTLEAFGELLTEPDQRALAEALPEPLAEAARRRQSGRSYDLEEFYSRVDVEPGQSRGFQLEHAQAVLATMADLLDRETLTRLRNHLPDEFGPLLEPREIPEHDGSKHRASRSESRKLSTAREGSEDRISEASDVQPDSVVATENPHADRKLSSREESINEGHDLATGNPEREPSEEPTEE